MRFFRSKANRWTPGEISHSPTFAYKGDQLVDVVYSEWRENYQGGELSNVTVEYLQSFQFSDDVDRIIFETPVGCFEAIADVYKGSTFSLRPEGDPHPADTSPVFLYKCQRTAAIPIESEEAIR